MWTNALGCAFCYFFFLITLVRVIKALVLSFIVLWAQWHLLCCVHGENQIKEADVGK